MEDLITVTTSMQIMLLIWIALVVLIVRRTIASGSVGLPAAMVLTMSFLYGGCFVYAVPGYTHLRADAHWYLGILSFTEWQVVQATFASLLGLLGFAIGTGTFLPCRKAIVPSSTTPSRRPVSEKKVILALCMIGAASFALHYMRASFPMSGALLELGRNVAVAAFCIGVYREWRSGRSIAVWMGVAALIPLYYLVVFGFVSYGFLFAIILTSFWLARMRHTSSMKRLRLALLSFAAVWLLLTLFIAWFSFRDEVREIVWQSTGGSLWDVLMNAVVETELFSPWNFASLDLINIRLNLNLFIGRMIEHHQSFPQLQEWGATLIIFPLVLVPRFLWSGKPERGGSGFMSEHTGMSLSDSATFGTGTVFEFFINFGYIGVFLGFVVLGWIIRRVDRRATFFLVTGDAFRFARLFVVGIVAIDPLLRPFFIVNGAVFAWIMMSALKVVISAWVSPSKSRLPGHPARWLKS